MKVPDLPQHTASDAAATMPLPGCVSVATCARADKPTTTVVLAYATVTSNTQQYAESIAQILEKAGNIQVWTGVSALSF